MEGLRRLWERLLDLLFPPKCPFCGRVTDRPRVCPACEKALPWTEGEQGVRRLAGGVRCAAPLWYREPARAGILRYKFRGASGAARVLGELMARCVAENFSGEFDVVTWVPVSRRRLRKRGYDQAELLARSACRLWDTEPVRLLRKTADVPSQTGLAEEAARRANVLGVFEALPGAEGRRILLVDDVCTTGATLNECVRVLRDAGAAETVCVTLALARWEHGQKKPEFVENSVKIQK